MSAIPPSKYENLEPHVNSDGSNAKKPRARWLFAGLCAPLFQALPPIVAEKVVDAVIVAAIGGIMYGLALWILSR